jgi:hypothetical protein
MSFSGNRVRFWLLPSGREALAAVLSEEVDEFEGFVVDEDHLGVWIAVPELKLARQVMLLRWEHFLTATQQWNPPSMTERPEMGFRPS